MSDQSPTERVRDTLNQVCFSKLLLTAFDKSMTNHILMNLRGLFLS